MKLLQIDTSILGEQSVSRQLTSSVIRQLSTAYPDAEIIHHDFALEPIPHLSDAEFLAWQGVEPNNETAQQRVARNTQYLDEFLSSDIVVIGAPMYNFSFPSQLKAWLDRLSVAGKTFRYTENGPQGLVEGNVSLLLLRVVVCIQKVHQRSFRLSRNLYQSVFQFYWGD